MNTPEQIKQLAGQVRALKLYCVAISMLLVVVLLCAASKVNRFDELTVERLNVVDTGGKLRLVIANTQRFPAPVLNGKTYPRAVNPAGIVFYDAKGNENGGIALSDLEKGRVSALAFDYTNADAVGLLTRISADGKDSTAGLMINARPAESLDAVSAARSASTRIALQNHNEAAELILSDSKGRPRLRLVVDADDHPSIEMLDEAGASVYSLRR